MSPYTVKGTAKGKNTVKDTEAFNKATGEPLKDTVKGTVKGKNTVKDTEAFKACEPFNDPAD